MKLSEFKTLLQNLGELRLSLPNGQPVPAHFHITEAGIINRHFVDCGGIVREDRWMNLQVWVAGDLDHRLSPAKLLGILSIAERHFHPEDLEIEVEYQAETIGRYGLEFKDNAFVLVPRQTDCLAPDHCGIPVTKRRLSLSELKKPASTCCAPGEDCC